MSDNEEPEVDTPEEEEETGNGEEVKELSKRKIRKNIYWGKLESDLSEYKNILLIGVDFVGSRQMQEVRGALRGRAVVLMGKNTIMRKIIRENLKNNPKLEALLPYVRGNMGFIFTNDTDLKGLRELVTKFMVPAAAKTGVISPINVVVPAGPTGLDPGQTSFFQTLNISTKISKGTIEITNEVRLCVAGEKVSASAVALLSKLNLKPFSYGITVNYVFEDGSLYESGVLDLTPDDLINKFCNSVSTLAAISFEIGQTNVATVPHSFGRAFKLLCAIAITTDYEFEEIKIVKEMLANPGAFAGPATGAAAPVAAAAAVEEEDEEEAAPPAMDMFGDGDGEDAADY